MTHAPSLPGQLTEQPCLIGVGDGGGFQRHDFGHFVGMEIRECLLEGGQ